MPRRKDNRIIRFVKHFTSLEIITFLYAIVTAVYILCFFNKIDDPLNLILKRCLFAAITVFLAFCGKRTKSKTIEFIRLIYPLALISYWYPETYHLTHAINGGAVLVPNLDMFFDQLDIKLFNCSPAMEFSALIPHAWFSEIMYFAYFAYYLIYAYIIVYFFFRDYKNLYKATFIILLSFFIYYIVFIVVPVEGPQFYYSVADAQVPEGYFFSFLMRSIQGMGEMPTGAFPSSHVGMTLIYLFILFKYKRNAFWITLPVACLLFASTVYIKAHYLVDVVAGFIFAPILFFISQKTYSFLKRRFPVIDKHDN